MHSLTLAIKIKESIYMRSNSREDAQSRGYCVKTVRFGDTQSYGHSF